MAWSWWQKSIATSFAVAQYLNDLAELDRERGIVVWLVEARAVRIEQSPWAPLFTAVVEPNQFTATIEKVRQSETVGTYEEFLEQFSSPALRETAKLWLQDGSPLVADDGSASNHVVLEASGPAAGGIRTVVALFNDGHVLVPFSAYAGVNSDIPIEPLTTPQFRAAADELFGFSGTEKQARTTPGWLSLTELTH